MLSGCVVRWVSMRRRAPGREPRPTFPLRQFETASSERIDMRAEFGGGLKGSAPFATDPDMARDPGPRTWPRPIKRPGRIVSGLLVPIRRIDAVKLSQQRRPRQFTVPVG